MPIPRPIELESLEVRPSLGVFMESALGGFRVHLGWRARATQASFGGCRGRPKANVNENVRFI